MPLPMSGTRIIMAGLEPVSRVKATEKKQTSKQKNQGSVKRAMVD